MLLKINAPVANDCPTRRLRSACLREKVGLNSSVKCAISHRILYMISAQKAYNLTEEEIVTLPYEESSVSHKVFYAVEDVVHLAEEKLKARIYMNVESITAPEMFTRYRKLTDKRSTDNAGEWERISSEECESEDD